MALQAGLEPATLRLGGGCSIRLSYWSDIDALLGVRLLILSAGSNSAGLFPTVRTLSCCASSPMPQFPNQRAVIPHDRSAAFVPVSGAVMQWLELIPALLRGLFALILTDPFDIWGNRFSKSALAFTASKSLLPNSRQTGF